MDLITLYAGFNDTGWPVRIGLLERVALWLQVHSINYLLLRDILGGILYQFEVKFSTRLLHKDYCPTSNLLIVTRKNIFSIVRLTKSRGIQAILIKQPITAHERNYTSLTYEQEYQSVHDKFERSERLSFIEILS